MKKETLTVRGKKLIIERDEIEIEKLKFYRENPRVYDSARIGIEGREPNQKEIKDALVKTEDVKTLKKDIESNGGLTDPVIVRKDNFEVVEGNRRLASYLELHEESPSELKWGKISCIVIQKVTDSDVNAILGQYHLKGKKEWKPYEQAGFIYRRNKKEGMSVDKISQELGITKNRVNNFIKVYSFMQEHGEQKAFDKWSYYDAYLNLRATKGKGSVKEARDKDAKMDKIMVEKIKSKEIKTAMHLRDRLPYIVANKKAFRDFLKGDSTFEEAWDRVQKSGSTDDYVERIKTFCDWSADNLDKIQKSIQEEDETGKKLRFQIKQLQRTVKKFKVR